MKKINSKKNKPEISTQDLSVQMTKMFEDLSAQMDKKLGNLSTQMDKKLGNLSTQMDDQFTSFKKYVDTRFDEIHLDLKDIKQRVAQIEVDIVVIKENLNQFDALLGQENIPKTQLDLKTIKVELDKLLVESIKHKSSSTEQVQLIAKLQTEISEIRVLLNKKAFAGKV
jgi:hypothetical protein